ncbi:hypothetical protein BO94DRAFT_542442 [Aspergillus sclerotioniger CBS 115572]|uniref:Uncharacterized protein n=1 Tax=Aspergillus sclerotioniger CBS 115572 TaxID=1450535 RepID=A0A317X9X7_9EURO|nr:hypothetical protein BO94DRAFT_542442 [Aspergillus sclerotioniger CBS 115572]PWY95185.1 hypothetical protein BO94DRAFT_542442 [Aspergillus sclerotioniger CBS 115572]
MAVLYEAKLDVAMVHSGMDTRNVRQLSTYKAMIEQARGAYLSIVSGQLTRAQPSKVFLACTCHEYGHVESGYRTSKRTLPTSWTAQTFLSSITAFQTDPDNIGKMCHSKDTPDDINKCAMHSTAKQKSVVNRVLDNTFSCAMHDTTKMSSSLASIYAQ